VWCSMKLQGLVPLASRIFKLFDYNHDGWVDLREVICGFTALLRSAHEEDAVRLCFKVNQSASLWWFHCIGFTASPLFNLLVGTRYNCHLDCFEYPFLLCLVSPRSETFCFVGGCRCMIMTILGTFRRMSWRKSLGCVANPLIAVPFYKLLSALYQYQVFNP